MATLPSLRAHANVAQVLMAKWNRSMAEDKFAFLVQTTFPFLAERVPYTVDAKKNYVEFVIAGIQVGIMQALYPESLRQVWVIDVNGRVFNIDPRNLGAETQLWAILYPFLMATEEDPS